LSAASRFVGRFLRGWKAFLTDEEKRLREDASACETLDMTPSGRAARFLAEKPAIPAAAFDAVLLWDLVDYLEPMLVKQMVASLTELLRPGGVILAMFHSKKPEGFQRYRVADSTRCRWLALRSSARRKGFIRTARFRTSFHASGR